MQEGLGLSITVFPSSGAPKCCCSFQSFARFAMEAFSGSNQEQSSLLPGCAFKVGTEIDRDSMLTSSLETCISYIKT